MKTSTYVSTLVSVVLLLGGCSAIKSVFPDKEKDYRFTTELPELVVPADIGRQAPVVKPNVPQVSAVEPPPVAKVMSRPVSQQDPVLETMALDETPIEVSEYANEVEEADEPVVAPKVMLRKQQNRPVLLQVNQNLERTWRIVGRAMSQQALEITERNTDAHYFVVHYDPEERAMQDESFWDDLRFIFGDENNQERAYRVELTETEQLTTVRVLDSDKEACKQQACVDLLLLLNSAIKKSLQE